MLLWSTANCPVGRLDTYCCDDPVGVLLTVIKEFGVAVYNNMCITCIYIMTHVYTIMSIR